MSFKWGDQTIGKGEKLFFQIPICTMASGYQLTLPVHIINGQRSGLAVLIVCTSHGDEFWSAEFCRRVYDFLIQSNHDFLGTIILVPVLNPLAFETGSRNTPIDNHNLNRVFPGSEFGSDWFTNCLAKVISEQILPKIDLLLDYHGGGSDTIIHYTYTLDPKKSEYNKRVHEIALASGAEILWEHVESRGTLSKCAEELGKLVIVPEVGGGGLILDLQLFDKAISDMVNMLSIPEIFKKKHISKKPRIVVREGKTVRPAHGGTFLPMVESSIIGKTVSKGTVLGHVVSPYTFERIDTLYAPFKKTEIMQVRNRISKVHPGDYSFIVGDGESGYYL